MTVLKRLGLILSALLVAACQRAGTPPSSSTAGGKGLTSVRASQVVVEGSSSGGGSFGDESSLTILRWAADDLSAQIRNASPEIFEQLPAGWTQQRLADLIGNVQPTMANQLTYQIPERNAYGQRLMFDYRDTGGLITATRLFTDAYAAYEVNSRPKHEFRATIEEVKLKLAHEAAHLMGLGLSRDTDKTEAREFAKRLMVSLDSDNIECLPAQPLPRAAYTAFEAKDAAYGEMVSTPSDNSEEAKAARIKAYYDRYTRAYVFNRPSGRGAAPTNVNGGCSKQSEFTTAIGICQPGQIPDENREYVTVFAPRSYEHAFNLKTIRDTILTGKRDYQMAPGYFSWETVDLRKAVLTDEGFRSSYLYDQQKDLNSYFVSYLDYRVEKSSPHELQLSTFPPLQRETWGFYRSQGEATINMRFTTEGRIQDARITITKPFDQWLDPKVPAAAPMSLVTPLTCARSYKKLVFPYLKKGRVTRPETAAATP